MLELDEYQVYLDLEDEGTLWIYNTDLGEGGQFSKSAFEEMVKAFYKENF